ncbi:MAG: bifunctional glutamate N-acetyltransferase/amino-acid acetyltransferase ArgJ [Mariprofundales bacterium]
MAVAPKHIPEPLIVSGFRLGVASCGVKSPAMRGRRNDVLLLLADVACHAAAVFTQNRCRAVCVDLAHATVQQSPDNIRLVVANAGNANAGTGKQEAVWAQGLVDAAAAVANVESEQVLSASTGVIGEPFPLERIQAHLNEAWDDLRADGWQDAAKAFSTTDTFYKSASRQVDGYTITGIAKGAGMIHPDMATMLAFIATDAPIEHHTLQAMLARCATRSFNSISVDGDTSTNDTLYLLASGIGLGHKPMLDKTKQASFEQALLEVCIQLAQYITRDGEGVSKFVTIKITGARTESEARSLGRTVAVSPLVKTAIAGNDPNWGRLMMAIGNADPNIAFDRYKLCISADDVIILSDGDLHPDYQEKDGLAVFSRQCFTIVIDLGVGTEIATVWTGDFTHEYIRINAEYRT